MRKNMIRPPDPPKKILNTSHQIHDINMSPIKRPRTSEDFLRFCDMVLSYANYPQAFYDEEEEGAPERKVESPLNSIGESARSNRSSTSTSDASVGEVETAEYDDTWGMITCWCGKPFAGRPMIECESCLIWLHLSCARVRKSNIPKHFKCSRCKPPKGRRKRQSSGNSEPEPLSASTPNSTSAPSGNEHNHMVHGHQLTNSHSVNSHSSGASGIHQLNHNSNHLELVNVSSSSNGQKADVNKYGVASDNHSRQGHGYNSNNYVNGHVSASSNVKSNHREMANNLTCNYASYSPGKVSNPEKVKKNANKTPKRLARPRQRKSDLMESAHILAHIKHNYKSGSGGGNGGFPNPTQMRLNLSTGPPNVTMGLPTPSPSPSSSTSSSSSHISINRGPPTLIPELSSS